MLHRLREAWVDEGAPPYTAPVEADETQWGGLRCNMSTGVRKALRGPPTVGKPARQTARLKRLVISVSTTVETVPAYQRARRYQRSRPCAGAGQPCLGGSWMRFQSQRHIAAGHLQMGTGAVVPTECPCEAKYPPTVSIDYALPANRSRPGTVGIRAALHDALPTQYAMRGSVFSGQSCVRTGAIAKKAS